MVNFNESSPDSDVLTLEVERGGRRFPEDLLRSASPPKNRIRKLVVQKREDQLPGLIAEALWNRLPWTAIDTTSDVSRDSIITAYIDSLKQIDHCREQVEELVEAACRANIEFRQALGQTNVIARDQALEEQLEKVVEEAELQWLPTRNVATGELMSRPADVYRQRLNAALEQATQEFAKELMQLFARLVDRQLFGLVEWLPNHCCRYHFFRQVVIQENTGEFRHVLSEELFNESLSSTAQARETTFGRRSIERGQQGKHHFRLARHEHEVINAVRTSVGNSTVVMPPGVVDLVKAIPEWLYPFVEVIDGDIIRERIIERDTGVTDWKQSEVFDEPIFGCEPGVIIGPYVLSGWGPREVDSELLRRRSASEIAMTESNRQSAGWRGPLLLVCSLVLALITIWATALTMSTGEGVGLVCCAAIAAAASFGQGVHDRATVRRSPTAGYYTSFQTLSASATLLTILWFVVRWHQPLLWLTPVVLVAVALTAGVIALRFR